MQRFMRRTCIQLQSLAQYLISIYICFYFARLYYNRTLGARGAATGSEKSAAELSDDVSEFDPIGKRMTKILAAIKRERERPRPYRERPDKAQT